MDAVHRFVKVEIIKNGSGDETDQQRCTICMTHTFQQQRCIFNFIFAYVKLLSDIMWCNSVPSSTTIAKFPSAERPTHVMFFVVEMGNVSDVLLYDKERKINS